MEFDDLLIQTYSEQRAPLIIYKKSQMKRKAMVLEGRGEEEVEEEEEISTTRTTGTTNTTTETTFATTISATIRTSTTTAVIPIVKRTQNTNTTGNMITNTADDTVSGVVVEVPVVLTPETAAQVLITTNECDVSSATDRLSSSVLDIVATTATTAAVVDDNDVKQPAIPQQQYSLEPQSLSSSSSSSHEFHGTSSSSSPLDSSDIVHHIISYIGPYQHRFIAAISHSFSDSYMAQPFFVVEQDKKRMTFLNASTMEHAKLCLQESYFTTNTERHQAAMCRSAIQHGNLDVLRYLRSIKCPWMKIISNNNDDNDDDDNDNNESTTICNLAVKYGHCHLLPFVHEQGGCHWDETTCAIAVRYGHFNCLQYMIANGCVWDATTCTAAAKYNQLPILQWSHENGCPWDETTCAAAALQGYLPILQWLIENGCLWDEETCMNAAKNGHLHVLQYALQYDCPCNMDAIRSSASVPDHIKEWFNSTYPATEVEDEPPLLPDD